jgi:diaminopimelate decarboxylase
VCAGQVLVHFLAGSEQESVTLLRQALEQMRRVVEELKRIARSKWK